MNYKDFKFNKTAYVRPNAKHRCGNQRFWGKACWQGPDKKGNCGGISSCQPVKYDDRFECDRPERAGGPCKNGPRPDGRCGIQQLPCQPTLSLRFWRKRFSLLVAIAVIVSIVSFSFITQTETESKNIAGFMLNPGGISSKHTAFSESNTCINCHEAHNDNLSSWLQKTFVKKDISNACTNCHVFEGKARLAHQGQYKVKDEAIPSIQCISCHTEHRGKNAELTDVTNQTCSNCHKKSFDNFEKGHSDFSKNFPYDDKQAIYFDHTSHIKGHFTEASNFGKDTFDDEFSKSASNNCSTCHSVKGASRVVTPKSYKQICQSCHDQQITANHLVVMTTDEVSPILMALSKDDMDSDELASQIIEAMSKNSLQPLIYLTGMKSNQLWQGLNSFELKLASSQWMKEESHDQEMEDSDVSESMKGWFFGENSDGDESIYYRPTGHADTVLKAWIDLFIKRSIANPDDEKSEEALATLLDPKGPGACGKCHATGIQKESTWGYKKEKKKRSFKFSHKPHISLMGNKETCDACHLMNKEAEFDRYFKHQGKNSDEYEAAFLSIKKESCTSCHIKNKFKSNCTLCHEYHGPSSYKNGFLNSIKDPNNQDKMKKVVHGN